MDFRRRYVNRASAAYLRGGGRSIPNDRECDVIIYDGRKYVVLRRDVEVLAVYRIRTDGILKRLKRWPSEVAK